MLILVFLPTPMIVESTSFQSMNIENDIKREFKFGFSADSEIWKLETETQISTKYIKKEYIEYRISDFTNKSDMSFVDATVIFKDNIEWNFPDLNIRYKYKCLNGFDAHIPIEMYNDFKKASFVKYVENQTVTSIEKLCNDDLDWGVDKTEAEEVWGGAEDAKDVLPGNPAGEGVKVAIIDSGIDHDHTDLDGNYKGGWDFAGNYKGDPEDSDPFDAGGHGTAVAGIIAAEDNGQDVIGVAPKASLYALKVWCWTNASETEKISVGFWNALDWAVDNDMDVISISMGTGYSQITYDLCNQGYNAGIVIVASAGNTGTNQSHFPSGYPSVICVGSVDKDNVLVENSNYGPTQELVAPGGRKYNWIKTTELGGGTKLTSGTSIACPMVSGVCALLLSAYPHLDSDDVRYILRETAVDLNVTGWDQYYGYGMVNAKAALDFADTYYQQPVFYEDGDGMINFWQASDSPKNVVVPDYNNSFIYCVKNYEAVSHPGYKMWAESPTIDLSSWGGANDLLLSFRFRCTSASSSSSVTQFRLRFYDAQTPTDIDFTNPTSYDYYIVKQNNRNGQTWISGYDSGWQTVSFTLLASEFNQFAGSSNRLVLRWGHHDSWSTNHHQTEYLDYLHIFEDDNAVVPNPPRELTGFGDGIQYITLTWKSPANVLATHYRIYRIVGSSYVLQATVDQDGFIDTTQLWMDPEQLSYGVTYYYRVRAYNYDIAGAYAYWSGDVGW